MTAFTMRPVGPAGGGHPAVLRGRMRELALLLGTGLVALLLALLIVEHVARPNWLLTAAVVIGSSGVVFLLFNPRLEVSVFILAIFLGCLDGPIKGLSGGGNSVAVIRDVLIFAVVINELARLAVRREPVRLPPLSGWVLSFIALVVVEALNPNTGGILKVLGGFRQQLEWVPFFFFGYALIRTKDRMRKMFLVIAVIGVANGIVTAVESRLSPHQVASWGPGYAEKVLGTGGASGTTFSVEGEGKVRPLGLGSDVGFGGAVGMIALPATLALLATARWRRRWISPVLILGALLAVVASQSRSAVLGTVITLIAFGGLSLTAGKQMIRPLLALFVLLILGVGLITVLSSTEGSSEFARYASIAPENVGTTAPSYKEVSLKQIPKAIAADPFGFGLGVSGAASGFGGKSAVKLEGHSFSSETEFNFIMNEVGAPGLILFTAFFATLLVMVLRHLHEVRDTDIRINLAAIFAVLFGCAATQFSGAFSIGEALGPYFWFAAGIAAYWLAGPGLHLEPEDPSGGSYPQIASAAS